MTKKTLDAEIKELERRVTNSWNKDEYTELLAKLNAKYRLRRDLYPPPEPKPRPEEFKLH